MMLDSDILEEAWIGIRRDFPFFSERYKVVILREMGYALKKAREDERIETSKKCDCYIGDIREGRGEFQHSPEENKEGAIVSLLILKKWIKKNVGV